jgi:hypothetical protein
LDVNDPWEGRLPASGWARQDSNLHATGYEPAALPLSYGPSARLYLGGAAGGGHTAAVRLLALLFLLPGIALADEVDLTRGSRRRAGGVPTLVLRAEGGNAFAPYGYVGGAISWLAGPHNEFELGAGGGFPGLQLGINARQLFGGEGGQFLLAELFIAGNTRVNRGLNSDSALLNPQAAAASSSLWTGLGFGFEQRSDFFDLNVAGNIIFTSTSLTPHFALHGGIGFGF